MTIRERGRTAAASMILAALVLAQAGVAASQDEERTVGDPALRAAVDAHTRAIFEAASKPEAVRHFAFTSKNVLGIANGFGTDASAVAAGAAGSQLAATVWSKQGKYFVEYYRSAEGKLLLVYETFVYFSDKAPADAWPNFLSQPAWERRTYMTDDGRIGYAESHGRHAPAPGEGVDQLRKQADRLAKTVGGP